MVSKDNEMTRKIKRKTNRHICCHKSVSEMRRLNGCWAIKLND